MAKSSSVSSSVSSAASVASATASIAASSASKSISSAASAASVTASTAASSVAKSISSASSAASLKASTGASSASKSLTSAATAASATASKLASDAEQRLSHMSRFGITMAVFVTILAVVAAGIYFAGYADDVARLGAKKYYVGKAKAEAEALGMVGGEAAQGFLKDSLKKNPVMGENELEQVTPGLGNEAVQDGLAGVSDRLGGLGKF